MARKTSVVPIFPLGIRPSGKKSYLQIDKTSATAEAKGQLVTAQVRLYKQGHYDEVCRRLRRCHSFDDIFAVFKDWPDIQRLLVQVRDHESWIWTDTTWSWVTQFYYGVPQYLIHEKIPLRMANCNDAFDYYCQLCSKGGHTTMEAHCQSRLHLENEYRFVSLYGSSAPPGCRPTFSEPVGKYLLDIDQKTDTHITVEPVEEGSLPEGFDSFHRPSHDVGYVVMVLNLSSDAKSVKVASSTLVLGPKLKEGGKKKYAIDFFSVHEANKRRAVFPIQTWRTLAFPVAKASWVEIRVDGNVIHHENLSPPKASSVVEYIINDRKGDESRSSSSNASPYWKNDWKTQYWKTCQSNKLQSVPLREFLDKSYAHVRSGRIWPVQFLGEDDFVMSAIVYKTEPAPRDTWKRWDDDKSPRWKNSWDKHDWSSGKWRDWSWKEDSEWTSKEDAGKDIILYLHGDQCREPGDCSMPGLANFLWPTPDAGPIKFASEKGELHGKVLIHPCCPRDSYWFRHPNVHDARKFNPQVATALATIRNIATRWGGDLSRFFVTGLSMGGYGGLELAALWGPKIVAGALIACPSHDAIRQDYFARRLHEVPMWIFHGRTDHLCKWEETGSLVLRMVDLGPRDLRFSSTGCKDFESHTDTGYCLENKVAYDWLQKRG